MLQEYMARKQGPWISYIRLRYFLLHTHIERTP
jgi:hypothetical protein